MSSVSTRRASTEQLIPDYPDGYLDYGVLDYLRKKVSGGPLILRGPKGVGKTIAIEAFAAEDSVPMVRHPCTEDDGMRDLYGSFGTSGEFGLGALTTAIEVANETGLCVLVLEEINALSPRAQKMLNPLTDFRQEIVVAKAGLVFRVRKGAHLWVVGTMNPRHYGGTYDMNEDLVSRFTIADVPYMPDNMEKDLLQMEFETAVGRISTPQEHLLLRGLHNLAKDTRGAANLYSLSTRDLVACVRSWAAFGGLDKALKEVEGKYMDQKAKEGFTQRALSATAIDLTKVSLWVAT
jgi:MoxR-like ATPase